MSSKRLLIQVLLTLLLAPVGPTAAASELWQLDVGGRAVALEVPDGFHPASRDAPQSFELMRIQTPDINLLLEALVTSEDVASERAGEIPANRDLFRIEIARQIERVDVGAADFAQLAAALRQLQESGHREIVARYGEEIAARTDDALQAMGADGVETQLPDAVPLGVYAEGDGYICFSQLVTYRFQVTRTSEPQSFRFSSATCAVHTEQRVLYLHRYRLGSDAATQDAARSSLLDLVQRMLTL